MPAYGARRANRRCLTTTGEVIDTNTLSSKAKQLLADYKMVQYDMSVGKNYLMDMGFMDIPKQ